jgi:[glutamine synthetase] adenylyltransferase / [glutamine synthetase]-adenylyl-L-tyrosine phosphorylase
MRQAIDTLPVSLRAAANSAWERICEHNQCSDADLSSQQRENCARMLACSEYAASVILRHWQWFRECLANSSFDQPPQPGLVRPGAGDDEAHAKKQLRCHRHRKMLHILWREYANTAGQGETLASLSTLADELLLAARSVAAESLVARFGTPVDASGGQIPLIILAMGKLGGFELNFSSDIDIIFLYPANGETNGPRRLSAQEYFVRFARRIVSLLDDTSEDGFVYRVDTRLRPFGESGPLVVSFSSLESYLLQHGRSWERYAYVKARVVGDRDNSEASDELLRKLIEPFVYRRYLDFGVFESLRDMKSLIAEEVRKRELADNIKIGPGGIREIEFIVQSLQLVRGGGNAKLRCPELELAMRELDHSRSLSAESIAELTAAYRFLRRLENLIQAIRDQQTHDIPHDSTDRARLALAMRFEDWDSLAEAVAAHRANVSRHFQRVAFRAQGERAAAEPRDRFSALWDAPADEESWSSSLQEQGFSRPGYLAETLVAFSSSKPVQQLSSSAQRRLRHFIPKLLALLQARQSPDQTLQRVLTIVSRILRRSAYIALLNENHAAMQRLVDLCEQSAYLADEIGRFPMLLDEMLDPRLFTAAVSLSSMLTDISDRLKQVATLDSERQIEILSQFQRATLFRIAVADFSGEMPVMKVSDALTELAEVVLKHTLELAWADMAKKHGEPVVVLNGVRRKAGLGVIAYGKLAGMELSYRSDLDLVFLHDSTGEEQQTDGASPLENSMFFARLVRRLVHFLTTQTSSGALYEVDTRLRPSGRSGLLVTSVDAFERYQLENAWTWEHQALLRSRPVAGSVRVQREFEQVRSNILRNHVDKKRLADEVRQMRARMRKQHDKSSLDRFDLKQGRGGIADLEFLVQYLALKNAVNREAVIYYRDNIRQLGTLGAANCLSQLDVSELQDIYRDYRSRLHQLALDRAPPLVKDSEFVRQRQFVLAQWQRQLAQAENDDERG